MKLLLIAVVVLVGSVLDARVGLAEAKSDSSAQDVKRETKEALQATKQYTVQQKRDFEKKTREELDRMEKQIDHLKSKAGQAKKETQAELHQLIGDMEEKRQAAAKKLKELQSASGKAWNDVRSGVSASVDELEKTYKQAVSRFP